VGQVIAAVLLGFALFGTLRARRMVEETWDLKTRRASAFGTAGVAIALLVLLVVSRSLLGVIVGAVLLGAVLYGSWRLRRV
jgi:hypothetical protein